MKRPALPSTLIPLLLAAAACTPTWNHDSGKHVLSSSAAVIPSGPAAQPQEAGAPAAFDGRTVLSRAVSFIVPEGWHWFERGDDLIATKDGVFLQHFFIERIHVTQTEQPLLGAFPLAAFSSKQWPVLTARNLVQRFTPGMPPAEAAEVLIASRRNDPAITGLQVQKVVTRTVAGNQAFRAVFEFRLKKPPFEPSPLYRSVFCGFMAGEWFYGISYTAAVRHYFDRDANTFEAFLESIRLKER